MIREHPRVQKIAGEGSPCAGPHNQEPHAKHGATEYRVIVKERRICCHRRSERKELWEREGEDREDGKGQELTEEEEPMFPYFFHDVFSRFKFEFFHGRYAVRKNALPESAYNISANDIKKCIAIAGKASHDA